MNLKPHFLAFSALCLSLLSGPAMAWGPEGHSTIGDVAFQHLSPQAKADVDWIVRVGIPALNVATNGCRIDPANLFTTVDPSKHAISDLANWADCYRDSGHSDTGPWHYDDVPLSSDPASIAGDRSWCKDGCVSKAFADNLNALAKAPTSPADTARALAYVVHFMGDMHQPMHAEDNGDSGGNAVTVHSDNAWPPNSEISATNLHSMWDTALVQAALGKDLTAAEVKLKADAVMEPVEATKGTSTVSDVIAATDVWIAGTHHLAREAYAMLNPPPATTGRATAQFDAHYVQTEDKVAESQLALASVRLTAALNAAMQWSPPS